MVTMDERSTLAEQTCPQQCLTRSAPTGLYATTRTSEDRAVDWTQSNRAEGDGRGLSAFIDHADAAGPEHGRCHGHVEAPDTEVKIVALCGFVDHNFRASPARVGRHRVVPPFDP